MDVSHRSDDPESFVGLLNEATIDIKQEPLGDYETGALGVDDGEHGEGEEEEFEEVDEGTFEDAANKRGPTRRTGNYTKIEYEALIKAWECVSLDVVTGADQTGKQCWQRIEDKFCHHMPHLAHWPPRTYHSL
jgi:hypothetical protein